MNDMSLKAKIRNLANEKGISSAAVLQTYLISRFLFRLADSEYKDKFIIKGGILISSLIGIEQRSTMDLDTSLQYMRLEESKLKEAFARICSIQEDDGIEFVFNSIGPIREDDAYGGYRIMFTAVFGKIHAPVSMDISTGDAITPEVQLHEFKDILEPAKTVRLLSYPIETVLAEKVETVLSRGIENTRPRDFYDIYMLAALDYDPATFRDAFVSTAKHRGTHEKIADHLGILNEIRNDETMKNRWLRYQQQMSYVEGISFDDVLNAVMCLMSE